MSIPSGLKLKKYRSERYQRRYKLGKCKDCGRAKEPGRTALAFCSKCSKRKTSTVRRLQALRRRNKVCIDCGKAVYKGTTRCRKHSSIRKQRWVDWSDKYRQKVFDHYGRVCACCGECEFMFLTIDHIKNDGAHHRRVIGVRNTYRWLCINGFPTGFQAMCSNCNTGKERNGGVCPHRTK